MVDNESIREVVKSKAHSLGFFACGVAKAEPVDEETAQHVKRWVEKGDYASMDYMARNTEKRLNPKLLMPSVKSIVSVAMNYAPAIEMPTDSYQLAAYALGKDYHTLVKTRLRELAAELGWKEIVYKPANDDAVNDAKEDTAHCRLFVDTAPVLERYWAVKAGLGWTGRNHQLIIPDAGSMFFLGEIFVDIDITPDEPMPNRCGCCHRCVDACPTKALSTHPFNASLCLSYQLIENRGDLSAEAQEAMGDTIYGCDRCQKSCPWNRKATPNSEPELQPKPELLKMTRDDWQNLSVEQYQKLFKGSAVKRVKYQGLKRNIEAAEDND